MSSEVHAKWMNSSERSTSLLPARRSFIQYSMALTSWLVRASMVLIAAASRPENLSTSRSNAAMVFALKGFSSTMAGSAASAFNHSISIRRR